MTEDLLPSQSRSVNLAIRAGRYRTRAEQAEQILADLIAAHPNLCQQPDDCNCPAARAIRHIKENQ